MNFIINEANSDTISMFKDYSVKKFIEFQLENYLLGYFLCWWAYTGRVYNNNV